MIDAWQVMPLDKAFREAWPVWQPTVLFLKVKVGYLGVDKLYNDTQIGDITSRFNVSDDIPVGGVLR